MQVHKNIFKRYIRNLRQRMSFKIKNSKNKIKYKK